VNVNEGKTALGGAAGANPAFDRDGFIHGYAVLENLFNGGDGHGFEGIPENSGNLE